MNVPTVPAIQRVTTLCGSPCVEAVSAEALHHECFCLAVDPLAVREELNRVLTASGAQARLTEEHAHLFSALPIFVPRAMLTQMTAAVIALTAVATDPVYQAAVMTWAPPIAAKDPGSPGGLLGFDFHLSTDGPRLIEINTNPGGLLLNAALAQAQRLCVPALSVPATSTGVEAAAIVMLLTEWQRQGGKNAEALIAIVDEAPEQQYLYSEFVLFKRLLDQSGHPAVICSPTDLKYVEGRLCLGSEPIGFVYNRLTDFSLQGPALQPLRQAYLEGAVALSPHPRAHALWADKRNLGLLCQPDFLATTGLPVEQQALIARVVPTTQTMTTENRDALWGQRRGLFFKPAAGFGGRASYRGDKLTHKTWEHMAGKAYVAQQRVPPSERHAAPGEPPMKVDIRCYAYEGEALFFAARLYQGQTTNFRTPGGGFAPVLTLFES